MPGSKELYDKLYSEQLYTNSYNDFVAKYGSEEGQNELYKKLSEQELYTNDINTFKSKYFSEVKKKDVGASVSSSGQPIGLSASPKNPSAYNKKIESSDWQRHQELTRTIQDAAQKNDALTIKNASKQLEQLRASNKNIASDPLLNEDLQTANKIIQKNIPTVSLQPTGAATQKPIEPVRLDLKPKAPIPTQERIDKLDALDKSLQSDIQLDDEDIKNLFVKDNIQLGFSEEGKKKLAEAEDQLNKEFGEGTFTDKIAGLYNSFLKNANVANLLPMAETGRDKALIKATAMYAKQNPNGKANEEEILQMAKDIRRKELEGKATDSLIEDFVGDNQRGITEGYAKWWALNTGQPYMPEDENQAEQIRATLSSVVNKTKAQEASFKSKALELQSLTNELSSYGKDLNNLTPEQAQAYKETYDKAMAVNTDLLDNYKNIDNDVNNLGDFQNELDLFKRNYNTLLNLSAKVGASGVRLTTGLMGAAQMVGKYAPGVSVDYANTDKIKFLDEMASKIEGAVERRKSIDDINSVGDFFNVSGGIMAEQLPQLFINASTGGSAWGLGLLASSAAGTKYNEIKDKENFTESQKIIASIATGAFEYVSEKIESNMLKNALPSYRVMSAAANGATKLELDAMRAELKGGLKNAAKRTIENVAEAGLSANQEGISEVVAQVGGNLVDRYVLNNKNVNVFDGLKDAYLTGAIMGGVITASPIIGAKIVAPFVSDESGELRKNTKKINELSNTLPEIQDEKTKEIISNSIEKLKKKNEAIIYGGVDVINNLTPEEIREGADNYQELQQIKDQYITIKNNKEMSDAAKKAVMEPLNERYNELVTKRKELINKANAIQKQGSGQVPVQPKTGVGQEVEQGKPEAKPQVVTEESKGKVAPAGKRLFNEPNPETVEISKSYKEKNGIVEPEGVKIESVDIDNASKIADAYEALEDTPDDPEVQDAYNAMADETAKQHQDIIDAGYEVEIWQGEGEPYANAQEMIDDVKNNKHMYIYSTEQGFGNTPITDEQRKQNKLLQDSGFKDKTGKTLLYNDLFRFVHDFFGHTERGNGFGAVGEENAWDVHARMYTPKARRAMTTETRGQNSWVNFGPQMRNADGSLKKKGDEGYLSPKERDFAPQKMALMPEEFSQITEVASNFDQALNKSAEALNVVAPELKVIVGENIEDVQNQIIEALTPLIGERQARQTAEEFATGTKGQTIFVDGKPFAVVFDKTTADSRTAGHEAWEVMLNDAFGNDQAKFKEFTEGIDAQLRAQGFDDIADALNAFASQKGYENVKYSEYMAELGGMLVESGFGKGPLTAQQKTLLQKIGDIINKFAELFTGKKQFLDQATPEDILGFMITISEKVAKGEDVSSFFREGKKAKTKEGVTKSRSQKNVPQVVDEVLTDDGKGNYLFVHYSDEKRDVIRPMSGSNKNFTSREEVSAISSVGGVAMYYTKAGQKEGGVGDVAHTVLVPKDKVYFYGTTNKGTVFHDPQGFKEEARRRFQEYKNRGNKKNPTKYAFDADNAAAWVAKVAGENGYDMLVTNWKGPKSYRAQTTKRLKPEAEYTGFKKIEDDVFEVGDEVFVYGNYAKVTDVNGDIVRYEGTNQYGGAVSGVFDINRSNAIMIEKAKPVVTTRAQRVDVKVIPGYDRMMNNVEGIMDKTMNARNGSYNKATANAISYIQKSLAYINADDTQREQIIREFNKIRGEKLKKAPSVNKILGKIKDITKVTINEAVALKEQIKLQVKAAKDAVKYINELRKNLSAEIAALEKGGKITAKQSKTIINRLGKINLENPIIVNRFVDYMTKVFNDAEYADKIRIANDNIKKIKRLYKGKNVQATVSLMAKNFLTLNPKYLSDIDQYLSISNQILQAVMRTQPADIKVVNKYIEDTAKEQADKIKNDLLLEYQGLVDAGILDDSMSIDDILEVIDGIEDNATQDAIDKGEDVRQYLVKMFNSLSAIGKEILESGVDPVTGLPVDLSDDQKVVLKQFLNMDIENMSIQNAKLALDYLSNFITNGITDGMGALVESYAGSENLKKFQSTGAKFRDLKLFFSKRIGGVIAEEITTLNILLETALSGQDRSSLFRGLSGFNDIVNGNAKARKKASQKAEEYYEKFKDVKDFFTLENSIEREVLAFLVRTNESEDELARRKGLIEQSIEKMMEGDEQQKAQAEIIKEVYERIGKNANTIQEVFDAAGKENREAVNWWIDTWSDIYDRLENISLSIYNSTLGKDKNYTPDVHSKINNEKEIGEEKKSAFMMSTKDYTVKKKAGVLIEAKKPSRLGENRVINFNFDTNNLNAYEAALIDIETAAPIRRIDGFLNSKLFSKLGRSEDVNLIKARINGYIAEIKGMNFVPKSRLDELNKVLDEIGTTGAAMVLGGISQIPKQSAGVMVNTFINSGGYLGLKAAFDAAVNDWIDNCGFPIANRSLESVIAIKTANKYIEEAARSKGGKVIELIKKANRYYLNTFLKNTDTFVARASFMAYYKKELKKKGIDTSNIDWATHKVDKSAAQYAQDMVDRQQNPSDAALLGNLMTSKDPKSQAIKKSLFAFMGFTLNQKTRMYSDIISLTSKVSTKKDKLLAAKSLGALSPEMATFSIVSGYLIDIIYNGVLSMMGVEESEEEKEKRRKRRNEQIATNIAKDFLSPAPLTDAAIVAAINKALDQYDKIYSGESYEKDGTEFKLSEDREAKLFENWGAAGITITRTLDLIELMNTAYSGKFEKEYQQGKVTTKYLRDNDREILAWLTIVQLVADFGLLPSEASTVVSQAERIAKKRALSEDKYKIKEYYKSTNTPLPDYLK